MLFFLTPHTNLIGAAISPARLLKLFPVNAPALVSPSHHLHHQSESSSSQAKLLITGGNRRQTRISFPTSPLPRPPTDTLSFGPPHPPESDQSLVLRIHVLYRNYNWSARLPRAAPKKSNRQSLIGSDTTHTPPVPPKPPRRCSLGLFSLLRTGKQNPRHTHHTPPPSHPTHLADTHHYPPGSPARCCSRFQKPAVAQVLPSSTGLRPAHPGPRHQISE